MCQRDEQLLIFGFTIPRVFVCERADMESTNSYAVQFRGLWLWKERELFLLQVELGAGESLWFRLEEDLVLNLVQSGISVLRESGVGFVVRQRDEAMRRDLSLELEGEVLGTISDPPVESQDFFSAKLCELSRCVGAVGERTATLCLVLVSKDDGNGTDFSLSCGDFPGGMESFGSDPLGESATEEDGSASIVELESWNTPNDTDFGDSDLPAVTGMCFDSTQLRLLCSVGVELLRALDYEFVEDEPEDDE